MGEPLTSLIESGGSPQVLPTIHSFDTFVRNLTKSRYKLGGGCRGGIICPLPQSWSASKEIQIS